LVMTFLAYLAGVMPLIRQAALAQSQQQQLTDASQQASRLSVSRGAIKQELARAQQAVASGSFQLRPVKRLNRYLALLTQLAAKSKLTLHEIQPGKATRGEHYWSVPVVMSGTGQYQTCALFLHGLNQSLPDTRLSSFKLTAVPVAKGQTGANFRFGLVWHASPDPTDKPD